MAFFIRKDQTYQLIPTTAPDVHATLPAGVYVIQHDPVNGFFVETLDPFQIPAKRYGHNDGWATRIQRTFEERPGSTGVLLLGMKGSGKSLLAKTVAMRSVAKGLPVLVINTPWHGDAFNSFLQAMTQPCVVLFDEFEKVYPIKEQDRLLTLFDGVFSGKKLFLVTANNAYDVHEYLHNRPGRFFYRLTFTSLEPPFIEEYCLANLTKPDATRAVCRVASWFPQFNFDMLQALVEEMNRYEESPEDALQFLNIVALRSDERDYQVQLRREGQVLTPTNKTWTGNPLALRGDSLYIEYVDPDADPDAGWGDTKFGHHDLRGIDPQGVVRLQNNQGYELLLIPLPPQHAAWMPAWMPVCDDDTVPSTPLVARRA